MKQKTALVAGSSGTIGNALTKRLREEGFWVRGVDIKYCEFNPSHADEFLLMDLRDIDNVRKAFHLPSENFDPNFVYYLLKHNLHSVKALDSGTASGRENVSKSSF